RVRNRPGILVLAGFGEAARRNRHGARAAPADSPRRRRGVDVGRRQPPAYNPRMSLAPGSRVGRYEIVGRLGTGGLGEVYRARDQVLDRVVAIKLLPDEFISDPDRLRRFELEARVTGRLNHPHIVGIFDAVLDGPQPFLVTELLEGTTLGARLASGPISVD